MNQIQFKFYLDIVWRRKWWIVVPLVLSVGAYFLAMERLPKIYRASTTILVTPQRLPEEFIRSTVTQPIEDRMSSMTVQILSRSFLEKVAREIGMLTAESTEQEIESACGRVRGRVNLEAGKNLSYFEVAAMDESPAHAATIANRLAQLFIDQNTQMRSEQATGTRATVESWLAKKKEELDELESQIADYKRGHLWELSDQLHSNFELLETSRERVDSLDKEIQRRQERLTDLRATMKLEQSIGVPVLIDTDPTSRQLATLEAELNQLLASYTDENPAVRRKRSEIEEFRRRNPQLGNSAPGSATTAGGTLRMAEMERVDREIASLQKERDAARSQISVLTGRIDRTPLRDQELQTLTRGYDALKKEYENLQGKRDQAIRAEELETSRKSEQFRVQDEARVPTVPFRPQPLMVLMTCLAVGLGLGAGALTILEFLDQSLKTEDDFRHAFPEVPLLSTVPHVDEALLEAEARSGRRRPPSGGRNVAMTVVLVIAAGAALVAGWTA